MDINARRQAVVVALALLLCGAGVMTPAQGAVLVRAATPPIAAARPGAQRLPAGPIVYRAGVGGKSFGLWKESDGSPLHGWHVSGVLFVGDGTNQGLVVPPYQPTKHNLNDYAVEARIRLTGAVSPTQSPPAVFGVAARTNYDANYSVGGAGTPEIWSILGYGRLAAKMFLLFNPTEWHTYRLEVVGSQIAYLIDGVVVLHTTDTRWTDGGLAGLYAARTGVVVSRFSIQAISRVTPPAGPLCGSACQPGALLYRAQWGKGLPGLLDWSKNNIYQEWSLQRGSLHSAALNGQQIRPDFAPGDVGIKDYAVEARIRLYGTVPPAHSYPPVFNLVARGGYGYWATYSIGSPGFPHLWANSYADASLGGKPFLNNEFDPTAWHSYRLEVVGQAIQYLIDGVVVLHASNDRWKDGGYAAIDEAGAHMEVSSFKIIGLTHPTPLPYATCLPHCPAGTVLYQSNFAQGPHSLLDWTPSGAVGWRLQGGAMISDEASAAGPLLRPDLAPGEWKIANYAAEAQMRFLKPLSTDPSYPPNYGIVVRGGYGYWGVYAAPVQAGAVGGYAELWSVRGYDRLNSKPTPGFDPYAWHTYRVEIRGSDIRFLIDGSVILTATNTRWTDGGITGFYAERGQIAVRRFTVTAL